MPQAQERQLPYIDGLRGLAILGVVAFHAGSHATTYPAYWPFGWLIDYGSHGVELFFILSGFCLSYGYLRDREWHGSTDFDLVHFFSRRIQRIYPLYLLALAIFIVTPAVYSMYVHRLPGTEFAQQTFSVFGELNSIVNEVLLINPHTTTGLPEHNHSFWSLIVEWHWYLFYPASLILWCRNKRLFLAWILLLGCILPLADVSSLTSAMLNGFLFGIIATECALGKYGVQFKWVALFLPVLFILDAALTPSDWGRHIFGEGLITWQLSSFSFFVLVIQQPWLQAFFALPPMRFIGVASYSIYLIHEPPLVYLEQTQHLSPLIAAPAVVMLGIAFWWLFERRILSKPSRIKMSTVLEPRIAKLLDWLKIERTVMLTQEMGTSSAAQHPEG